MSEELSWLEQPVASAGQALGEIAGFLPNLLAAVALGLLGWLAASLARSWVRRLGGLVERLLAVLPRRVAVTLGRSAAVTRVLGDLAFWLVIFLFLVGIAAALELDAVSAWLARLAAFLPALLAGALIIVIGIVGSILLGQVTTAAAAPAGSVRSRWLGLAVQVAVLVVALVLGLGQMGLNMTLPVALIVAVVASLGGALMLAFALGAVDLVRDLVGAQGLLQHCELNQRVRIDGVEGRVVELTATGLILATGEGRVIVPGRVFHERGLVLLEGSGDD